MEIQNNKRKWKSRKNKNEESAEDAETQCNNLVQLLTQKAPNLTPKIIPRGFDDDNLQNLCKTPKQQEDLQSFIEQNQKSTLECPICSYYGILQLDTVWSLDFSSSTYKLEKIQLICERCKTARCVEKFVSSRVPENIVQHFIRVNYGTNPVVKVSAQDYSNELESILSSSEDEDSDEDNTPKKKKKKQRKDTDMEEQPASEFYNVDGALYAEVNQAYSIAYALKVLASNMQSLQVVDMHGNTFSQKTDIAALLASASTNKNQKKKTKTQSPAQNNVMDESQPAAANQTTSEKKKSQPAQNQNGKQKVQPAENQNGKQKAQPKENQNGKQKVQSNENQKQKVQPKEQQDLVTVESKPTENKTKQSSATTSKKAALLKKLKKKSS